MDPTNPGVVPVLNTLFAVVEPVIAAEEVSAKLTFRDTGPENV